ncbi:MAG: mechanosensitive ion channel [Crocinitomicaceae bacterium]|nr:mechanosensitive ion channel [Crocinitomicaceae bacterium]
MKKYLIQIDRIFEDELVLKSIEFALISIVILALFWLLRKAMTRSIEDDTMRYRAKKVSRIVSYSLILVIGFILFAGYSKNFGLAIGLISAGLAFALQEVVLAIAGWISIYFSKIYSTGDRIELNGVVGDVIDIGVTKTTLMEVGGWIQSDNYNGRIVKISNAFVFKGTVKNYSTDFPFLWDEIRLPIRYGSDIEILQKILEETIDEELIQYADFAKHHWKVMTKKYLIEDASVDPLITFQLNDNWIEFNFRYVVDYKSRLGTKHRLFKSIKAKIEQTNGQVSLASSTFEIVGVPDLQIRNKQP